MPSPDPRPAAGHPANLAVLEYLMGRSAHSGVAEDLLNAVRGLDGVEVLYPDPSRYSYVATSAAGVVFAFAVGMGTVGLRVRPLATAAAKAGAVAVPELGPDWVLFDRGSGRHWPDLSPWAERAYDIAVQLSSDGTEPPTAGG